MADPHPASPAASLLARLAIHNHGVLMSQAPQLVVTTILQEKYGLVGVNTSEAVATADPENVAAFARDLDLCRYMEFSALVLVHSHVESAFIDLLKGLIDLDSAVVNEQIATRTFSLSAIRSKSIAELEAEAINRFIFEFDRSTFEKKINILFGIVRKKTAFTPNPEFDLARAVAADEFRQAIVHRPQTITAELERVTEEVRSHMDALSSCMRLAYVLAHASIDATQNT